MKSLNLRQSGFYHNQNAYKRLGEQRPNHELV